jgi:hypothetical protein
MENQGQVIQRLLDAGASLVNSFQYADDPAALQDCFFTVLSEGRVVVVSKTGQLVAWDPQSEPKAI